MRQNVLWGIKQCNQGVADLVGGQFGANGYEISYHSNPRPSHADMGGRQYAAGRGRTVNGVYYPPFSSVEGLLGDYNCYHFKFSILLGISEPAYSKKQLAALKARDAEKIEFEGKTYTRYEATQMQRQLEAAARHAKDRQIIAKAAGDDTLMRTEQARINSITPKYAQFSKAAGYLCTRSAWRYPGYHKVKTVSDTATRRLANRSKSGIIVLKNSDLTNGLSIRGKANSVVDKIDDTGRVLQRRKYDNDGKAIIDFDTSDHSRPDIHPTGAHKHIFDYSFKEPRRPWTYLTEQELAENADIIRKGENYHDEN